jgi:hypothetical protein
MSAIGDHGDGFNGAGSDKRLLGGMGGAVAAPRSQAPVFAALVAWAVPTVTLRSNLTHFATC